MNGITILRLAKLCERTGLRRSTIYRKVKQQVLTPSVRLGERAKGWPAHEIDAILAARIAGRTDDEIRELVKHLMAQRTEQRAA